MALALSYQIFVQLINIATMNPRSETDGRTPFWMRLRYDLLGITIVLGLAAWAAVKSPGPSRAVPDSGLAAPRDMAPCVMNSAGYLNGRLYGALTSTIDWHGIGMTCDGMTRPNNQGIRLVFASAEFDESERLIFVIGIDGEIGNLTGKETKANITIIDEGSGRFFSAGRQDRCWTTVQSVEPAGDQMQSVYQVAGDLYCATALPSLTGKGSVTLGDFRYSGRLILDEF